MSRRLQLKFLSALVLLCLAAAPIRAQAPLPTDPAALRKEQDALFERILRDPKNLDIAFRHAEISTALGDYEAAIGSLERMLFFNPNLPRVMLELGVLYFRLGSYEMARTYFTNAVAAADTPAEVRSKVDAYVAEIDRRLSPNLTYGFVQTGVRYQTNANAGPDGTLVRVFGLDATLNQEFVKAPDWNWFAQGVVRNVISFENQRGDTWETTVAGYASKHDRFDRLDTLLIDVQTGPRLALFPESVEGWSIRPYVGLGGIMLGGHKYLATQLVGAAVAWTPTPGWLIEAGYDRGRRAYKDTVDYPTADQQSGMVDTGYVTAAGFLFGGIRWVARGSLSDVGASVPWQSYVQKAAELSLPYTIPVEVLGTARPLTLTPFALIRQADYDAPDPFVDPTTRRKDTERAAGLVLDLELWDRIGFGVRAQYSKTDSSLPNYELSNFSVYGGPIARF